MASVIIKCKECGEYAERGVGGTGAQFCSKACKQRDFRRRRKAERDAFTDDLDALAAAGDWEEISHRLVADPRAAHFTAAELMRAADLTAEKLGIPDAIFLPYLGWVEPSRDARSRIAALG